MDYLVKQQIKSEETRMSQPPQSFELFTSEVIKDINNKDVTVPKLIGVFTVPQLEAEKAMLEERIAEVNKKLEAIQALIANQ